MDLRLLRLSPNRTAVADVVAWGVLSFGVGYLMHRRPASAFAADGAVTRLRSFEADGRWYERRLDITSWKGRIPEAGGFYAGGFSKSALVSRAPGHLERYVAETRRAEMTHWALIAAAPSFALWNPLPLVGAQVAYALAANLPCIAIQRYNRARLSRVLVRRRARLAQPRCSMR